MDGTMIDNMMVHHRAWQKKLASIGLEMSLEEVMEKVHGVNVEILEKLFGDRFSPEERIRIAAEKEAEYRRIFLPQLGLIRGLQELLDDLLNHNIPMAVATAAPPENVQFVLDNLKLHPYFQGVFHANSVQKGKPDPEVFELAANSMNCKLSDCIVFEDSLTGAEAARRGGAQAIIVTTTHAREEFAGFDHILQFISDFQNLSTKELLQMAK